ncbi:MAG: hypothetical protein E7490_07925 [Ruminococcaceae bacterium]|nr:hypothetical protein [Oscillospiraceae bacterium]
MKKKIIIISAIVIAVIAVIISLAFLLPQKTDEEKYNEAKTFLAEGDYNNAYLLFRQIKGYADSSDFLEDFEVICEKKIITSDNSKITKTFNKDGKPLETINDNGRNIHKEIYTYDENGNPTSSIMSKDGIELSKSECNYDEDGNLLKKTEQQEDILLIWENTYENGYPVKKVYKYYPVNSDKSTYVSTSELFYDNNNQLIKVVEVTVDSMVSQTITSEYNNGLVAKEFIECKELSYNAEITYTYDNAGNLLTKHCKNSDGHDYYERKCTYNEKGKLLTEINLDSANVERYNLQNVYSADGILKERIEVVRTLWDENEYHTDKTHSYYDDKGNVVKEETDSTYNFVVRDYTYDNMNNLIKEVYSSYDKESDGSVSDEADIITETYTYDSYGNMLSETYEYSDKKTTSRYEYTGITVIYNPKI